MWCLSLSNSLVEIRDKWLTMKIKYAIAKGVILSASSGCLNLDSDSVGMWDLGAHQQIHDPSSGKGIRKWIQRTVEH